MYIFVYMCVILSQGKIFLIFLVKELLVTMNAIFVTHEEFIWGYWYPASVHSLPVMFPYIFEWILLENPLSSVYIPMAPFPTIFSDLIIW